MRLAQRMVSNFCASISTSNGHRWTTLAGMNEVGVRVTVHKSTDPGQPNGVVLSAATTIWLPISPQNVFSFFKDERTRPQVYNDFFKDFNSVESSYSMNPLIFKILTVTLFFSGMFFPVGIQCKRLRISQTGRIPGTAYQSSE